MRVFTVSLAFLLMLTACAPAAPPTTAPTEITAAEPQGVMIDGTFETSLLAATWGENPKGSVLFPLDPASGTALPGYEPIFLDFYSAHAFSPDRQTLAVVSFPKNDSYYHHGGSLWLIDLPAWKSRRFELGLEGWVSAMSFSPDGQRLAIAHGEPGYHLTMVDGEKGNIVAQLPMQFLATHLKFTGSGQAVMVYNPGTIPINKLSPGPSQILLLEAEDLRLRWSQDLEGIRDGFFPKDETITQSELYEPGNALQLTPALAFAPDRDALYIVHADSDRLTTVDFDARKVETIKIQPKLSWFERLLSLTAGVAHAKISDGTTKQAVISPDGQFLYVVGASSRSFLDEEGRFQTEEIPLGLEIVRSRDGSRVEHFDTESTELSISPDGRFLYMKKGAAIIPWTEIFDTASRQLIARKEAFYATPALMMNGQFLLVSTYVPPEAKYQEKSRKSILQPSDLSVLADWTDRDFIYWLTP